MVSMQEFIHQAWTGSTLEGLQRFIRIPAKSSSFDADWEKHGYLLQAVQEAAVWGKALFPNGLFEVLQKPGIPPALYVDIPAAGGHTGRPAFFYGHLDKQPETEGWSQGLGPWTPVVQNGRLYGRGSADDGYSYYLSLTAAQALDATGTPRPRITGLFETEEESGSGHLAEYLEDIAGRIGSPAFLGILDITRRDYGRLWITQSLRGVVSFRLKVEVLKSPVHSGSAAGIVPSSFSVMRELLDRLEDPATGRVKIPAMHAVIPERNIKYLKREAEIVGNEMTESFPWAGDTEPRSQDPLEALKRNTWEPAMTILGADGLPPTSSASALLRPYTTLLIAFRIPPYVDAKAALDAAVRAVTTDVPSHAKVTVEDMRAEAGFDAPAMAPWLEEAAQAASCDIFGSPAEVVFDGATIGTMNDFMKNFPEASFLNTGVLGVEEHAHAPDESLDLAYAEKLTAAIARIVAAVPEA